MLAWRTNNIHNVSDIELFFLHLDTQYNCMSYFMRPTWTYNISPQNWYFMAQETNIVVVLPTSADLCFYQDELSF